MAVYVAFCNRIVIVNINLSPIERSLVDCVNSSSIGLRLFYLNPFFNVNISNIFNGMSRCFSEMLLIIIAEVIHILYLSKGVHHPAIFLTLLSPKTLLQTIVVEMIFEENDCS